MPCRRWNASGLLVAFDVAIEDISAGEATVTYSTFERFGTRVFIRKG